MSNKIDKKNDKTKAIIAIAIAIIISNIINLSVFLLIIN